MARAVIPPVGQSRPNHAVIAGLARRLGARNPGFEMTEWQLIDAVLPHVRLVTGMDPQTLIVEGIWPNSAFVGGLGINALTSAEPAAPNGGAVYHDTAIWLRPAESDASSPADEGTIGITYRW